MIQNRFYLKSCRILSKKEASNSGQKKDGNRIFVSFVLIDFGESRPWDSVNCNARRTLKKRRRFYIGFCKAWSASGSQVLYFKLFGRCRSISTTTCWFELVICSIWEVRHPQVVVFVTFRQIHLKKEIAKYSKNIDFYRSKSWGLPECWVLLTYSPTLFDFKMAIWQVLQTL